MLREHDVGVSCRIWFAHRRRPSRSTKLAVSEWVSRQRSHPLGLLQLGVSGRVLAWVLIDPREWTAASGCGRDRKWEAISVAPPGGDDTHPNAVERRLRCSRAPTVGIWSGTHPDDLARRRVGHQEQPLVPVHLLSMVSRSTPRQGRKSRSGSSRDAKVSSSSGETRAAVSCKVMQGRTLRAEKRSRAELLSRI